MGKSDIHVPDYNLVGHIVIYQKHVVPQGVTNKQVLEHNYRVGLGISLHQHNQGTVLNSVTVTLFGYGTFGHSLMKSSEIFVEAACQTLTAMPFTVYLLVPESVERVVLCGIIQSTAEARQHQYAPRREPQSATRVEKYLNQHPFNREHQGQRLNPGGYQVNITESTVSRFNPSIHRGILIASIRPWMTRKDPHELGVPQAEMMTQFLGLGGTMVQRGRSHSRVFPL